MIAVGTIVSIQGSHLGKVVEVFDYWRPAPAEAKLHHVHYIDTKTGKLYVCPDSRCKGEHTCPIHGANCWAEQLTVLPQKDLDFYVKEGMIAKEILS